MHRSIPIHWLLCCSIPIAACGGGEPTGAQSGAAEPADTGDESPPAEGAAEADEAGEAEGGEAEAEAQDADEPSLPDPEPIEATDAKAVREALLAARGETNAFVRIVDPELGVGGWDREEDTRAHFCDRSRFGQEPTLGYELRDGDDWVCDDELTRCRSVDPENRTGTLFHFRKAGGDGRWLSSVIRYHRPIPRRDPENVAKWVEAADGVCKLRQTLTGDPEEIAPDKLTVFVSRFTEDVEKSTTELHCGEEATKIAKETLAPVMETGAPTFCHRLPTSCVWLLDPDTRVYGDPETGSPYAIAKLAADLREGPARAQRRQAEAAAKRAAVRRCD